MDDFATLLQHLCLQYDACPALTAFSATQCTIKDSIKSKKTQKSQNLRFSPNAMILSKCCGFVVFYRDIFFSNRHKLKLIG